MAVDSDPRNRHVVSYINGKYFSQYDPALPLFDSGFLHGKQVWSAPRLINGRIFRLQDHLDKIRHSAELNFFPSVPDDDAFVDAIRQTLARNGMYDGVHVRVLLTAGDQVTASMDLDAVMNWDGTVSEPRLIVMPEFRSNVYDADNGITLMTSSFLRPGPDMVDQASHDNNQNASSRALLEAKRAGMTSSLMYDKDGFLAEAPASHVGIVKDGVMRTPFVKCSPPGVTRKVLLELCDSHHIPAEEADLDRNAIREADELFLMGTMSGPVGAIALDGTAISGGKVGPVTRQLSTLYRDATQDPVQGYDLGLTSN